MGSHVVQDLYIAKTGLVLGIFLFSFQVWGPQMCGTRLVTLDSFLFPQLNSGLRFYNIKSKNTVTMFQLDSQFPVPVRTLPPRRVCLHGLDLTDTSGPTPSTVILTYRSSLSACLTVLCPNGVNSIFYLILLNAVRTFAVSKEK